MQVKENRNSREKAQELIKKMSLEEKAAQLTCFWPRLQGDEKKFAVSYPYSAGCLASPKNVQQGYHFLDGLIREITDRSPNHIPPVTHMEGLCGAMVKGAAAFPSGLARGCTFDPDLEYRIGKLIGEQERAVGITQTLAPVLDVTRDPRMGRYGESYGEDPTLVSAMGVSYIRGMQENAEDGKKTRCVAKHFLAYHNVTCGQQSTECEISERQLREIYAKPFQAAITEGGLHGIMPCYNTVNGHAVSGSKYILTELLRNEMGFEGACWSDYSGIFNLCRFQKTAASLAEAGKQALEAGMDAEFPAPDCFNSEFLEMLKNGEVDREAFEEAVTRVLTEKFEMGLFEAPYSEKEEQAAYAYSQPASRELPLEAARKSVVLLKNDGVLPLSKEIKKIAVIGCHGDDARYYFGGYTFFSFQERALSKRSMTIAGNTSGYREVKVEKIPGSEIEAQKPEFTEEMYRLMPKIKSLYEELSGRLADVDVTKAYGYPFAGNDCSHFDEALKIAGEADLVIVTLGGKYSMGTASAMGEGLDSMHIGLPECQECFLEELEKLDKKVVGIHIDGRPVTSDRADRVCNALLEAWSPAEYGSEALVDILSGLISPSGKLSVSVPLNEGQIPIYYNHKNGSFTHKSYSIGFPGYVDGPLTPRYAFGHGLTYTDFAYSDLDTDKEIYAPSDKASVSFTLENTGNVKADEVVQLYFSDEVSSMVQPNMSLQGFRRVSLAPGEKKRIIFTLPLSQLAFLSDSMKWKVEKGDFTVKVGTASDKILLKKKISVNADLIVDGKTRGFFASSSEN